MQASLRCHCRCGGSIRSGTQVDFFQVKEVGDPMNRYSTDFVGSSTDFVAFKQIFMFPNLQDPEKIKISGM